MVGEVAGAGASVGGLEGVESAIVAGTSERNGRELRAGCCEREGTVQQHCSSLEPFCSLFCSFPCCFTQRPPTEK